MSTQRVNFMCVVLAAGSLIGAPAYAITHASDYASNMGNYRTCTDPLLETCGASEVISPSNYHLADGTKTTIIHKSDGTVQLRIDAGAVVADTDISYACDDELFECVSNECAAGPREDDFCNPNRCMGGTNHFGTCTTASACPGGSCTGGASCVAPVCQGGLRDGKACGGSEPACTSTADTIGWNVVFRGNRSERISQWPNHVFELRGDGSAGCMKVCGFSLDGNGAINSNGLSCSTTGPCGALDTFHHVEILDPDDEVLAIPTVGNAEVETGTMIDGDPARVGD